MSEEARRVRHSRRQCSGSGDALGRLHSSFMRAFICPSPRRREATGGMPSALIAERSKVFLKEEAESAIYICNGTAGCWGIMWGIPGSCPGCDEDFITAPPTRSSGTSLLLSLPALARAKKAAKMSPRNESGGR